MKRMVILRRWRSEDHKVLRFTTLDCSWWLQHLFFLEGFRALSRFGMACLEYGAQDYGFANTQSNCNLKSVKFSYMKNSTYQHAAKVLRAVASYLKAVVYSCIFLGSCPEADLGRC